MAIITLNDARLIYSEFSISTLTDKKIIKTGSINSTVYSSGQVKTSIKVGLVTSNLVEHQYLNGVLRGGDYYNNQFKLSIPKEYYNNKLPNSNNRISPVSSGAHTIAITTPVEFDSGSLFNIFGDDTLYTVVSKSGRNVTFYPRLKKELKVGSPKGINTFNPTIVANLMNTNFDISSAAGTEYYSKISLNFLEV